MGSLNRSLTNDDQLVHRVDLIQSEQAAFAENEQPHVIYLVDDDSELRSRVTRWLTDLGYAWQEFESAEQFLEIKRVEPSGCILVAQDLPGLSGLDLQHALIQERDLVPLILMMTSASLDTVIRAIRNGAVTILQKPLQLEPLRHALREAFELMTGISFESSWRGARSMKSVHLVHLLSPREREVASMVADGLSNKQIAGALGLSEKTIEKYRSNCVRKLNARSSAEMVRTIVTAEIFGVR